MKYKKNREKPQCLVDFDPRGLFLCSEMFVFSNFALVSGAYVLLCWVFRLGQPPGFSIEHNFFDGDGDGDGSDFDFGTRPNF